MDNNSSEERDLFTHTTIDKSLDEIRLIALQPCEDSRQPIDCNILTVRLSDEPRYEALSYMWGSGNNLFLISLQGSQFHVGCNLWLALKHLRRSTQQRILWIDALCINQADVSERNHQVGLMSLIYSRAACVVAWLGSGTEKVYEAISFLKEIADGSISVSWCDEWQWKEGWSSVSEFLDLQYWTRLWIIQELMLAPQVILQWGQDELPAGSLIRVRDLLNRRVCSARTTKVDHRVVKEFARSRPVRLLQPRGLSNSFRCRSLVDLLLEHQEAACKDIRDKVFGLCSLSMECCRQNLAVDYSKTATEIYQSAFQHSLAEHPRLGMYSSQKPVPFRQAAILGRKIHSICNNEECERKSKHNRLFDGEIRSSQPLIGTVIYTTPLEEFQEPRTSVYIDNMTVVASPILLHICLMFGSDRDFMGRSSDPAVKSWEWWDQRVEYLNRFMPDTSTESFLERHTSEEMAQRLSYSTLEENIDLGISILRQTLRKYPTLYLAESDISVYLDNHGMIRFTPSHVLPGDEIWDDVDGSAILVRRKTTTGYLDVHSTSKTPAFEFEYGTFFFRIDPPYRSGPLGVAHRFRPEWPDPVSGSNTLMHCHLLLVSHQRGEGSKDLQDEEQRQD